MDKFVVQIANLQLGLVIESDNMFSPEGILRRYVEKNNLELSETAITGDRFTFARSTLKDGRSILVQRAETIQY